MLKFSHRFNFYNKLTGVAISALGSMGLVWALSKWIYPKDLKDLTWAHILANGVLWLIGAYFLYHFVMRLLYGVDTILYVRRVLGTTITLKEAKMISFLFDASVNKLWYPLKPIAKAPLEKRRQKLFEFAHNKSSHVVLPLDCQLENTKKQSYSYSQPHEEERQQYRYEQYDRQYQYVPQDETYEREANILFCLTVLGLQKEPTSLEELKKAYRKKMKEHHPDLLTQASSDIKKIHEEQSKKINYAYEQLKTMFF